MTVKSKQAMAVNEEDKALSTSLQTTHTAHVGLSGTQSMMAIMTCS